MREANQLENLDLCSSINRNREAATLIIIYFCGLRALEEIDQLLTPWFVVHSSTMIELRFKGKRKNEQYNKKKFDFTK
eukprot:CAMPEP_0117893034 /NCGR_PEP_ID=MMETSP0950-20121206/25059_1 /TAXON_ID=44440 /ORGANISM="Chattonella subsalsa, Strain CCMP2191" /LENGTH=77 /DNA_ID=CAMNT_0005753163 /DNA_START=114 /DNA_END=344 /DNA_ORIENTATION=-